MGSEENPPRDLLALAMTSAGPAALLRLTNEAAAGEQLTPRAALAALRNPHSTIEIVELILGAPGPLRDYEVRREVVSHRATPLAAAVQLVPTMYWRDLATMARSWQVRPQVRRSAEKVLLDRLPAISAGERASLARIASAAVAAELARHGDDRTAAALLENPRLVEEGVVAMAHRATTQPAVLRRIGDDRRFGCRPAVVQALCQNPHTPIDVALRLLPRLPRSSAAALAKDRRLAESVRQRARVLSGES